jgi:uncharacterized membrane protein
LLFGAALASLAWALTLRKRRNDAILWLVVGSAILMTLALGLTLVVNVPINKELMTWSQETPPADLAETWMKWEFSHSIRTLMAIAAFVCQAIALSLATSRNTETAA